MKQTGDGNEEFTPESDAEPSPEQPVSAEAAALELLAKAEAGATGEQAIKTPVDKAGTNDAPAAGGETSGEGAASPAQALATIQALALPAASTPAEAKPESTAAPAEPETIIGKNGAKAPQAAATQLPAQGGETADAATDRTASSPEDAASSVTAQEKSEISGKVPAEASHTAPRPTHEARTENGQGQFQSAAARVEALPPGLAALPDNARALQAQLAETRPQTGPHPHGARGPESAPTSLSALPIEIGFRALEGTKRFDIRLDPAELGRVDVSLSFDKDGEVTAKLVVDRVETLHLLQRDARTLERAFDQAGLRTSDAGVQISLSDRNAGNGGGFEAQQDRARGAGRREEADAMPSSVTEIIPQRRLRLGGVDMNI
jgi:flagellar hook-length control protein FliK